MKRALISGITGQDGSYLAELLLTKGYRVVGVVRRSSTTPYERIAHLVDRVELVSADLLDQTSLTDVVHETQPDDIPESTVAETAIATLSLLEICRDLESPPRFFHAASSELFGVPDAFPQSETTPFRPVNPYGCAKAFATDLCRVYREAHGMFVVNGILYNHESPRRGESFVTRKIASTVARIARGSDEILQLGNLDSERDWGYAPEFVEAIWLSLQHPTAEDFIFATGTSTTVRDFAEAAFREIGISLAFEGEGKHETARDSSSKKLLLTVDSRFFRPVDSHRLAGDSSKARRLLGWTPLTAGTDVARILARSELKMLPH